MQDELQDRFRAAFGCGASIVCIAPGRVNLIGEHTDYSDGFVFPAAIDKFVSLVVKPNGASRCRLISEQLGECTPFDVAQVEPGSIEGWGAYPAGVAWVMRTWLGAKLENIDAYVSSDVPIGSGVSSSAALELAFACAWNAIGSLNIDPLSLALLAQKAENEFVGVRCGVMDQMASALGREGHGLFIDTRSLEYEAVALPTGITIVVCETGSKRDLSNSAYNERRRECEDASKVLGVRALRDADPTMLDRGKDRLHPKLFRRARHVISENQRCLQFRTAIQESALHDVGALMTASHASLRDDFEVSSQELDQMAECANAGRGCIGARMMGAGFGGACIALVLSENLYAFIDDVTHNYQDSTSIRPMLFAVNSVDGAKVLCNLL